MGENTEFICPDEFHNDPKDLLSRHYEISVEIKPGEQVEEITAKPRKREIIINNKKFLCPLCKKSFKDLKTIAEHLRKPQHCIKKKLNCSKLDSLHEEHIENQGNDSRKHNCPQCGFKFKRKDHLVRHIQSQHTQNSGYPCKICKRIYTRKDHVIRHMKEKHSKY